MSHLVQADLGLSSDRAEEELGALLKLIAGQLTDKVSLNLSDNVESLSLSASLASSAQKPTNQKSFAKGQCLEGNEPGDLGSGEGQGPDGDGDSGLKLGHTHQEKHT